MSAPTLATGTRVGPYEVLSPPGARDGRLGRQVTLRLLAPGQADAARAAAAVRHPNLPAIYDVVEHEGGTYLVLEPLEGRTLRERLRDGPLAARDALRHALDAAYGLAAAHRAGVVHGGIDAGSLFITRDGSVKILDLGQGRGDARDDIVAFGAVLRELGLADVAAGCLERRFRSMAEVAAALEAAARPPRPRRLAPAVAAALVAVAAVVAARRIFFGRAPRPIAFDTVTFRRGAVTGARFLPGGGVVCSAAWDGAPADLYRVLAGNPEAQPLSVPGVVLAAVARGGELAVLRAAVLEVPGAPRPVAEGVAGADWMPDGKTLAILRPVAGGTRIETVPGRTIATAPRALRDLRASPDGERLAYRDGADLAIVRLGGERRTLSTGWDPEGGLAWSPDGRELWLAGGGTAARPRALYAVGVDDPDGRVRTLLPLPGPAIVRDVSAEGRVLLELRTRRGLIGGTLEDGSRGEEWSFLDGTHLAGASADGRAILFNEGGQALAYLWRRDRPLPIARVRLGDGFAAALSSDGRWAAFRPRDGALPLALLPTDGGEPRSLSPGRLAEIALSAVFPDGKRVLFEGREAPAAAPWRVYLQAAGGEPRPVGPPMRLAPQPIAPDGRRFTAVLDRTAVLVAAENGIPRPIPGALPGEVPVGWSEDGSALFLLVPGDGKPRARLVRVDLATGERRLWLELTPADPAGFTGFSRILATGRGQTVAYGYDRVESQLVVVAGVPTA